MTAVKLSSIHPITGFLLSACLIISEVDLDYLLKVVSGRFLHCQVPFLVNRYLGVDALRPSKELLHTHLLLVVGPIYSYYCDALQVVIFLFPSLLC